MTDASPHVCPTCGSNEPSRHPAVQAGGEVTICVDEFHLNDTPLNSNTLISEVRNARIAAGLPIAWLGVDLDGNVAVTMRPHSVDDWRRYGRTITPLKVVE